MDRTELKRLRAGDVITFPNGGKAVVMDIDKFGRIQMRDYIPGVITKPYWMDWRETALSYQGMDNEWLDRW